MKKLLVHILLLVVLHSYGQEMPPPSYNSIGLNVFVDASITNEVLKNDISEFLSKKGIGQISSKINSSNLLLSFDDVNYNLTKLPEEQIVYKIDNAKPSKTIALIKDKISKYAHGFQINNLNLKNEAYEFSFRIKPVDKKLDEIAVNNFPNSNGILNFNTHDTSAILEVSNLSPNPIYFSIIEINSKGELSSFIPNSFCALIGKERYLKPGETISIESCLFNFAPPYETITLKGFASSEPINFDPIIQNKDNASLKYIKNYYTEMFTYEFNYNIIDDNGNMPYNTSIDTYKINTSPELDKALYELKKINRDSGFKGLYGIKGSKKVQNSEYISKLKGIAELHRSLGNKDEANDYYKAYVELKAKQEYESRSNQKQSNDKARIEAARKEMIYKKMTDAEKVIFLEKENAKKNEEISDLKTKITELRNELNDLASLKDPNNQKRGSKPSKKEPDFLSKFTYRALIIAEEDYEDENIKDLKFPISDAKQLKSILTTNYAFKKSDVTFLKNPTRNEIFEALHAIYDISTQKDHLLIFYAGHGVYDEGFKRGYWLPSDSKLDNKGTWMSNLDIKDYITNIKTKHTLLISDACFSGSIFEYNRDVDTKKSTKTIDKLLEKNARNAMTSGLDKPVPDQSVFIKYLLKTLLENENTYMKASDLFNKIQEVVLSNTDNIPQYGVIRNANHEGGEFIFLKRE